MVQPNTSPIHNIVNLYQMKKEVLLRVSIPMYFYNIIVPQLGDYYDLYPVNFENKPVVCCPLHDEDTPSCRYYPETESFYCFGCQKGGNVINLHKYFYERMNGTPIDNDSAVSFLFNFFLRNNPNTPILEPVQQTLDKPEIKSSDVELMRFNKYISNLESSLLCDLQVKEDVKKALWESMDTMDLLVSTNKISAVDAQNYIKAHVRNLIK